MNNNETTTTPDAIRDKRAGPTETPFDQEEQRAVEGNLQQEIEALIPRLRRYALALTQDVIAADDLVQDCLSRALGKIHLWQKGTDLRAWLFTILHNQHVSRVRRQVREWASIELLTSGPRLVLPPHQVARLELRDIGRALAELPEEQRSVILLIGLEGMGYEEVAATLNLPIGTVRSRLARGRENLRIITGLFPRRHSPRPRSSRRPHMQITPPDRNGFGG